MNIEEKKRQYEEERNRRNELDQEQLAWRRDKIMQLDSQGYTQAEIAKIMQLSPATISLDIKRMRNQSKESIRHYLDESLPHEYKKCVTGIDLIMKESWIESKNAETTRDKIQALHLAKECYAMKMDLLTNAGVVDDAIRFINEHKNKIEKKQDDIQGSKEESIEREEQREERIF